MTYVQKQYIDIPENREMNLKVPLPFNMPVGKAKVAIRVVPEKRPHRIPVVSWFQDRYDRGRAEAVRRAAGCLANNPEWQGDAVEIQRQLRAEWEHPWEKESAYA